MALACGRALGMAPQPADDELDRSRGRHAAAMRGSSSSAAASICRSGVGSVSLCGAQQHRQLAQPLRQQYAFGILGADVQRHGRVECRPRSRPSSAALGSPAAGPPATQLLARGHHLDRLQQRPDRGRARASHSSPRVTSSRSTSIARRQHAGSSAALIDGNGQRAQARLHERRKDSIARSDSERRCRYRLTGPQCARQTATQRTRMLLRVHGITGQESRRHGTARQHRRRRLRCPQAGRAPPPGRRALAYCPVSCSRTATSCPRR